MNKKDIKSSIPYWFQLMDPGPAGDHGSLVLFPVVVGSNPEPDLVAIQRLNMAALTVPDRRQAPKHATLIIVPVSQSPFGRLS